MDTTVSKISTDLVDYVDLQLSSCFMNHPSRRGTSQRWDVGIFRSVCWVLPAFMLKSVWEKVARSVVLERPFTDGGTVVPSPLLYDYGYLNLAITFLYLFTSPALVTEVNAKLIRGLSQLLLIWELTERLNEKCVPFEEQQLKEILMTARASTEKDKKITLIEVESQGSLKLEIASGSDHDMMKDSANKQELESHKVVSPGMRDE
ncbi:hypothetical protein EK904_010341 [Melospiza melodia maxima]|nr:hypothetical protein EK904_010341 [Melospiza melodia maxima]